MFTISQDGIDHIAEQRMLACEEKLLAHIEADFQRDAVRLGPNATREIIHFGIERSRSHGYKTEQEMYIYLTFMFMLGSHFDEDPQLSWLKTLFERGGKMEKIHNRVMRFIDEVYGENNEHLIQALMDVHNLDLAIMPIPGPDSFRDACLQLLQSMFPKKFEHQGEESSSLVVAHAVAIGKENKTPESTPLIALLMFILGIGAHKDPIHPWIQQILEDPNLDSKGKQQALYRQGLDFIEESLKETA